MKLLVLGSNGQLGLALRSELIKLPYNVIFTAKEDIDISNYEDTKNRIQDIKPNVIINLAAYTNVDEAEIDKNKASIINNHAVKNIADICNEINCWLIHISTDYVFDGKSKKPYVENDLKKPLGVYGATKLNGEKAIQESSCKYVILRTAWIYSEHGNNFFKTILNLANKNKELSIIDDQIGSPTYAPDLAKAIIKVISKVNKNLNSDIFHFAGNTNCSWAEFASIIFNEAFLKSKIDEVPKIIKINSKNYTSLAKRPSNSRLDSSKFVNTFGLGASDLKAGITKSINKMFYD